MIPLHLEFHSLELKMVQSSRVNDWNLSSYLAAYPTGKPKKQAELMRWSSPGEVFIE